MINRLFYVNDEIFQKISGTPNLKSTIHEQIGVSASLLRVDSKDLKTPIKIEIII